MNFGNKIKTERKKLHLTQSELANKIGVSMRTVQSYEKGTCYPKQREIYQKLAKVFNCSVNYLLTESENFITQAEIRYGQRGAKQAKELILEINDLFSSGELAEEDMDEMMKAIQDAYWIAKEKNRKYVPKKFRVPRQDS